MLVNMLLTLSPNQIGSKIIRLVSFQGSGPPQGRLIGPPIISFKAEHEYIRAPCKTCSQGQNASFKPIMPINMEPSAKYVLC